MFAMARNGSLTAESLENLWFPGPVPTEGEAALQGILRFYLRTEALPSAPSSAPAAYDFYQDRDVILSGFQEKYGLDLTDPQLSLHWWRFMALLEGLLAPDLAQRAYVRTAKLEGLSPEAQRELRQLRRRFDLSGEKETVRQHLDRLDEIIARGKEASSGRRQHHS